MKRLIRILAISILITLFGIEAALALLDPMGFTYYAEMPRHISLRDEIASGSAIRPGTYTFREFSMTVLPDYSRRVPDTSENADYTLVILGDSVTFGWGVNDDQTFANIIAQAHPDWHVINAGVTGYNSDNARRHMTLYPGADRYIYLTIYNDPVITESAADDQPAASTSWMALYLHFLPYYQNTPRNLTGWEMDYARYENDLRAMRASGVEIVAMRSPFPDDRAWQIAQACCEARVIDWTYTRINPSDNHPNAEGHRMIADAIR